MDLTSLVIGLAIGLIIGFIIAWVWVSATTKAKSKASNSTEAELKALLAQQAQQHLNISRNGINTIEKELVILRNSVAHYEQSLQTPEEDKTASAYFGEHASLFLRNSNQGNKHSFDSKSEAQPRDFANNGSGLFVGTPLAEEVEDSAQAVKVKANK